jgi:hypothetical protein
MFLILRKLAVQSFLHVDVILTMFHFFEYCPFLRQCGSQTSLHTYAIESDIKILHNLVRTIAHFFLLRPHTERTYEGY